MLACLSGSYLLNPSFLAIMQSILCMPRLTLRILETAAIDGVKPRSTVRVLGARSSLSHAQTQASTDPLIGRSSSTSSVS
ncbi:hypothetical protein BDV11DRAFT_178156 [Aspergillus similis]